MDGIVVTFDEICGGSAVTAVETPVGYPRSMSATQSMFIVDCVGAKIRQPEYSLKTQSKTLRQRTGLAEGPS